MSHHVTSHEIPVNGEHLDKSKIAKAKTIALAVMVIGSLLSVYLLFFAPKAQQGSYSYSWVFALFYFFTLALGACFWTLLHNVSNSGWGTSVRRVMENVGSVFPWLSIFAIPLLFPSVQSYLYEWMNMHRKVGGDIPTMTLISEWLAGSWNWVLNGFRYIFTGETLPMASTMADRLHHADHLMYNKHWYMNLPFWYFRSAMFFIALGYVIYRLRKLSTAQDTDPNPGTVHLFTARRRAAAFLPILALTVTFAAFDWLKGMDYTWFSTMYGVYIFAGCAINSMGVIIITTYLLRRAGYLKNVVTQEHFHIMGKLLFAFTVFWAYVTFSQYFLIWYANITEETRYFLIRNTEGWNIASIALVILHFVVPFVILLQQWLKKKPHLLSAVAVYMLLVHILDIYLIVIPERGISLGNIDHKTFGNISVSIQGAWMGDILAFVTIGAGFVFFLLRALGQHSLYPHRDPRILESANLTN
ncbi:MAG: hypothetical protein B9S37_09705 [Verrucomicrobiia bacterium Tous-C3TDCM]|jgi:hypothetical protein|nr:MAG: hypothetical protein B9S37_09705 [Verrucomicrobiae bacterium Tous-C3TDCM]PAZ03757.1 MAG: hypothetical protein CAK88_13570 [Verrucomicrobiae bacterium AMD-G2]